MKSKSFIRNLFTIAFPIILQDFLSSFVNMLDTIMVGQLGAVDIAAMAFCLGFVIMPMRKVMPYIFNVEQEVLSMASVFIIMRGLIFAFDAFNMTSVVGVFRSGGDTLFALFMDVGFLWLLALPLGWLAVLVWHLPFWAVYLCILSEPICKATVGIIRLLSNKQYRRSH